MRRIKCANVFAISAICDVDCCSCHRRNVEEESLEYDEVQYTDEIFPVEDKAYSSAFKGNRHRARDFVTQLTTSAHTYQLPQHHFPDCCTSATVSFI